MSDKKYSPGGLAFTEYFEGCRLAAYQCEAGVWTIGYGHTKGVKPGQWCTREQAEQWLIDDVAGAEAAVNRLVKVPINQAQFDALVDFVFNLGEGNFAGSTLLKRLNAGDYAGAGAQFGAWVRAGGHVSNGLVKRRKDNEELFTKGDYGIG
jgi:lysozyme